MLITFLYTLKKERCHSLRSKIEIKIRLIKLQGMKQYFKRTVSWLSVAY